MLIICSALSFILFTSVFSCPLILWDKKSWETSNIIHGLKERSIDFIVLAGFLMLCASVSVLFVYDPGASKVASK